MSVAPEIYKLQIADVLYTYICPYLFKSYKEGVKIYTDKLQFKNKQAFEDYIILLDLEG